jgi:hypothetical protein
MWKTIVFLVAALVTYRIFGMQDNFTPLFALAVFMPRLTDNTSIQYLLPVSIMAFTNLFLEPVNMLILVTMLTVFAVTPSVSRYSKSLIWGTTSAVMIWHVAVNGSVWFSGQGFAPFTLEAMLFDFRLLFSTGLYVALFYTVEQLYKQVTSSNRKLIDRFI